MQIITIHGIRRKNKWYETFENLEEFDSDKYEILHFDYGYFNIFRFLTKSSREKIIAKFQKFYSDNIDPKQKPPSIICHSFGSYIWYSAITKYPSIKFDKVILCGSILNPSINFAKQFKKKQIKKIKHEYGIEDGVVGFSKYVLGETSGNSGKIGFNNIPKKYKIHIYQEELSFNHSDYFLPIHMETSWIPFLIGEKEFSFNKSILNEKIIDRLYMNFVSTNSMSTHALYSARIDKRGNYHAKYSRRGINLSNVEMRNYDVCTSADAVHNFNDMKFSAYGKDLEKLSVSIEDDGYQRKHIRINFKDTIKKGDVYSFEYKFIWKSTIGLDSGDTDHFWIGDCRHVEIYLNFQHELIAPRFYLLNEKAIVDEVKLLRREEKDGSVTYFLEYDNEQGNDGIIFYFDGQDINCQLNKNKFQFKPIYIKSKDEKDYIIERCNENDIRGIYKIESTIEKSNAANESILFERLRLFPDGFLVVKNSQEKIVGYLESVIWHDFKFQKFSDISNFPLHFSPYGDTLYVIFIAIHPDWRGKHLGLALVNSIVELAKQYGVKQVKLVAKDKRIGLYQKCGFDYVKELPEFLDSQVTKNILMINNLKG